MSNYAHTAVRRLTNTASSSNVIRAQRAEEARAMGWKWWLDGTPVSEELYNMGFPMQKFYPFLSFYSSSQKSRWKEMTRGSTCFQVAMEVYVCMPSSPYAVAVIGYGQYQMSPNTLYNHYMVKARGIANEKYNMSSTQFYMRLTGNIKVAIKNAMANLIPYGVKEIVDIEYEALREKSTAVGRTKASQLPILLNAVSHNVLLNEIRALHAVMEVSGDTFSTPEFRAIVENMDDAVQLANAERNKRVDALLVNFIETADGVRVECAEVSNIRNSSYAVIRDNIDTHLLASVPQFIVEKVSVLQGLANGTHVDSIGMKLDDKLFWVEK